MSEQRFLLNSYFSAPLPTRSAIFYSFASVSHFGDQLPSRDFGQTLLPICHYFITYFFKSYTINHAKAD